MKIHEVFPGRTYAVTSAGGCTVSTPDGVVICTAAAGQQAFFVAPCPTVQVSDEAALVTQSFKPAPGMLPGAGGNSGSFQPEGDYLVFNNDLTTVEGRLDNLVDGSYLFYKTPITAFGIPLPALKTGYSMFYVCTGLPSFSGDLSALVDGSSMFYGCKGLTTFSGDLSALTDGGYMFRGCKGLTTFSGDLSSLKNGDSMFQGCKLNLASVQHIASTINDLASQGKAGSITIGMDAAIEWDADLETALAAISARGWSVTTERYNS